MPVAPQNRSLRDPCNVILPGQYFDAETGLSYNYFRDYDPAVGRYVQSDPIGLRGGINTYLYAEAAPNLYTDPFGLVEAVLPWVGPRVAPLVRPGVQPFPIDPIFPIVIPSEKDVANCEADCDHQWDKAIYWCEVMWKMKGRPKGGWSACKRQADRKYVQCIQDCHKNLAGCPAPPAGRAAIPAEFE
jgi:RHS repeat-associated protein